MPDGTSIYAHLVEKFSNLFHRKKAEPFTASSRVEDEMRPKDWSVINQLRSSLNLPQQPVIYYEGSGRDLTPLILLSPPYRALYLDPIYNRSWSKLNRENYPKDVPLMGINPSVTEKVPQQFESTIQRLGYDLTLENDWEEALNSGHQKITFSESIESQVSTIELVGTTHAESIAQLPPIDVIFTNYFSPMTEFIRTFSTLKTGGYIIFEAEHNDMPQNIQLAIETGVITLVGRFTTSKNPFHKIFSHYEGEKSERNQKSDFIVLQKIRDRQSEIDFNAIEGLGVHTKYAMHRGTAVGMTPLKIDLS